MKLIKRKIHKNEILLDLLKHIKNNDPYSFKKTIQDSEIPEITIISEIFHNIPNNFIKEMNYKIFNTEILNKYKIITKNEETIQIYPLKNVKPGFNSIIIQHQGTLTFVEYQDFWDEYHITYFNLDVKSLQNDIIIQDYANQLENVFTNSKNIMDTVISSIEIFWNNLVFGTYSYADNTNIKKILNEVDNIHTIFNIELLYKAYENRLELQKKNKH